jgi:uncharacterized protein
MILEGLVTTTNADGTPHLAPMGPRVEPDFRRFLLRPFPTSNTCRNLLARPHGVLHVTDNVLLLAKAAVGAVAEFPSVIPAGSVPGWILADCCRYYEFTVTEADTSGERVHLHATVSAAGSRREFFGFNRAKHAVLEAAILATRFHLLPAADIDADFRKLRVIVDKTAGPAEREAMAFLEAEWDRFRTRGER